METILMSEKEAEIQRHMEGYRKKEISLKNVSDLLRCSYRTTKRYWRKYKTEGLRGIISRRRGKSSNRAICPNIKKKAKKLLREYYFDFGPTLASEKLWQNHQILLSRETVRKLMIEVHLWIPSQNAKVHQRRDRRSCEGELNQSDASVHLWFEERGEASHLLCVIDDATGKIGLRFEKEETKDGYFQLFEDHMKENGIPKAVYTDKRQVFVVNNGKKKGHKTQFQRAMDELGVEMILAHSPQAKGRVERAFRTLQDRLIKELRLRNISTIEEANKFLPTFVGEYNQKFGRQPASPFNAYTKIPKNIDLSQILCDKESRIVSKNLEINFKGKVYQIFEPGKISSLRKSKVTIIQKRNGEILVEKDGVILKTRSWHDMPYKEPMLKIHEIKRKISRKVSKDHPWKRTG
jgi:hypothetical protein